MQPKVLNNIYVFYLPVNYIFFDKFYVAREIVKNVYYFSDCIY